MSMERRRDLLQYVVDAAIDILIVQGTRQKFISEHSMDGYRWYFEASGDSGPDLMAGVAVLLSPRILQGMTVTKRLVVRHRCMALVLASPQFRIHVIAAYAPQETADPQTKRDFWQQLTKYQGSARRREWLLLGIDANGHIGEDGMAPYCGSQQPAKWNSNGQSLAEFCYNARLYIENTQDGCKNPGYTWQARHGNSRQRIDYLCASRDGCKITENTGAVRQGAWVPQGTEADHFPVQAEYQLQALSIKFQKRPRPKHVQKWCSQSLRSAHLALSAKEDQDMRRRPNYSDISVHWLEKAQEFQASVEEAVKDLPSLTPTQATNILTAQLQHHFPVAQESPKTPWVSLTTLELIATQRLKWHALLQQGLTLGDREWMNKLRNAAQEVSADARLELEFRMSSAWGQSMPQVRALWEEWASWRAAKQRTRQSIRADRQAYVQERLEEAQRASQANQMGSLWETIKKLGGDRKSVRVALKRADGLYCEDDQEELTVVSQYLKEAYKATTELERTPSVYAAHTASISELDLMAGLMKIPDDKKVPIWSAPTRAWKLTADTLIPKVANSMSCRTTHDSYDLLWERVQTVWLLKHGQDPSDLKVQRPINLSETTLKAHSNVLQQETREIMLPQWLPHLHGAIPGRSTVDALASVTMLIERLNYQKLSFAAVFVDSTKAFDLLSHNTIRLSLDKYLGQDSQLTSQHKQRLEEIRYSTVRGPHEVTLRMTQGVPQGDPNGPILFNMAYQDVTQQMNHTRESTARTMHFQLPRMELREQVVLPQTVAMQQQIYIDDLVEIHLVPDITVLPTYVSPILDTQVLHGMQPNLKKTKLAIRMQGKGSQAATQQVHSQAFKQTIRGLPIVQEEKYLGCMVNVKGSCENECRLRCENARKAHGKLRAVWKGRTLSIGKKLEIYRATVEAVMMYGAETQTYTRTQLMRLETMRTRHLRHLARAPAHIDRSSNYTLRQKLSVASITSVLTYKRLSFWARVAKAPHDHLCVLAAYAGTTAWSPAPPTVDTSQRIKLLKQDIMKLNQTLVADRQFHGFTRIDTRFLDWVATLSKTELKTTLTAESTAERNYKPRYGPANQPVFVCHCKASFDTLCKLKVHQFSAHQTRDVLRAAVVGTTCPLCARKFASNNTAMAHFQLRCSKTCTPQVLHALLSSIAQDRSGGTARQPQQLTIIQSLFARR